MNGDTQKREFPELSWETTKLYNRLEQIAIGETITYKDLSLVIDKDVQFSFRRYLNSALRKLQSKKNVIFEVIPSIGLKRLNEKEKIQCGNKALKKIKRAAQRGTNKLKCINMNQLENNERMRVFAQFSALGGITLFTKENNLKKIETTIGDAPKQIEFDFKSTLGLFNSVNKT